MRFRLTGALVALVAITVLASPARAQVVPFQTGWFVVPFAVVTPSARTYWLGEGAALIVGDELERLGLRVVPREARIEALDALRLPTTVTLTHATSIRVAQLLGSSVAVFGQLTVDDASLTLRVRVLQIDSGQFGPEVTESGRPADVFSLCRHLAQRLSNRSAATTAPQPAPPPLDAFEAYVKAQLTERPDARVRLLQAALSKAPAYDRVRLALWQAYTALGEPTKALEAVTSISSSSPATRTAKFDAALSLIELKRYDDAFETLKALADARPEAAIMNNLGVVQLRRGWTPQTGRPTYFFNKAAELEPDDADLFFNLGYAYWEERDAQAAVYWLREALRRDAADADAHFVLAAALGLSGASPEAERERTLAQQLSSRYADREKRSPADAVPRGLERVQESLSPLHPIRFDAALRMAAQRNQQDLVVFHLERARRFFEQQRDGDAEPELRRVLFLAPYNADAHLLLGRIYLRSGRVREATAAFQIAVWSEDTATAHVALAEALLESRDSAGARREIERALKLDPESQDARALLDRVNKEAVR